MDYNSIAEYLKGESKFKQKLRKVRDSFMGKKEKEPIAKKKKPAKKSQDNNLTAKEKLRKVRDSFMGK